MLFFSTQGEAINMAIEALQAEPSGGLISRESAIATLDRTDEMLDEGRSIEIYKELLRECFKVLPTNVSGDLISRADAFGAVQDHFDNDGFKGYHDGQKMMDRIKALPSADAVSRKEKCMTPFYTRWKCTGDCASCICCIVKLSDGSEHHVGVEK